jgi:hypothetical protein
MIAILLGLMVVMLVVFLPSALLAWIVTLCLGALGVNVPFLAVFGLTFVAGTLFGARAS